MHIPVLQKELLKYLNPQKNENFVDATIDGGGDALAVLQETEPKGKILGIDWTPEAIDRLKQKIQETELKKRLILVCENFVHLKKIVVQENFQDIAGVILDLGMSNWHLEDIPRGFSFQKDEVLDMRYNPKEDLKAEDIVNQWSPAKIERILREYGGERFAHRLTREITKARQVKPIQTTQELVALIERVIPRKGKIHPATKTFQALRIAVNQELENLTQVLPQAGDVLKPGGKLAVISFHSLEDNIVKHFFRQVENEGKGIILTKNPIVPSEPEKQQNPKSRSAKLRVIQKN